MSRPPSACLQPVDLGLQHAQVRCFTAVGHHERLAGVPGVHRVRSDHNNQ